MSNGNEAKLMSDQVNVKARINDGNDEDLMIDKVAKNRNKRYAC